MIVDITIRNFRSFPHEQLFSMNVETGRERHRENYAVTEGGKLAVLRSAAIFGANASGKSNMLRAVRALKWLITEGGMRPDGDKIPPYEPYKLAKSSATAPVELAIEFIVPSGVRYQYSISYVLDRVITESLYSYVKRHRSLIFTREEGDNWEDIKFGGSYKGGSRRFPIFKNNTYIARAGNDASAPDSVREIVRYFRSIVVMDASTTFRIAKYYSDPDKLRVVSDFICLADTGVKKITTEINGDADNIRLPEDMPDDIKSAIIEENRTEYKYWMSSDDGLIPFDEDEMSDGTTRLFGILPLIFGGIKNGVPVLFDELDGHLHTNIVSLMLKLFHDDEINIKGGQLIFTTHDTNVMNPEIMRRDQIWIVGKSAGESTMIALDNFDKRSMRSDSPFEDFYKDGRLGGLPQISYKEIRKVLIKAMSGEESGQGRG